MSTGLIQAVSKTTDLLGVGASSCDEGGREGPCEEGTEGVASTEGVGQGSWEEGRLHPPQRLPWIPPYQVHWAHHHQEQTHPTPSSVIGTARVCVGRGGGTICKREGNANACAGEIQYVKGRGMPMCVWGGGGGGVYNMQERGNRI